MITLTENAKNAIEALIADGPDDCGIRIASESEPVSGNGQNPAVSLRVAARPEPNDEVIQEGRARVFVQPAAAQIMGDHILDARVEQADRGAQVSFFVS